MNIEIPKITDWSGDWMKPGAPGWFQPTQDGEKLKPVILCNCGRMCGIALHHVHPDGSVTNSFYHKRGMNFAIGEEPDGCEWHVFLKLKDYDGGEFLPRT